MGIAYRFSSEKRRLATILRLIPTTKRYKGPDAYLLPWIDDCLDSEISATLDWNAGYWHVPVAQEDRDNITFT